MGKLIKKEVEKAEIMHMDEDKLMDVAKAAGETSDVKDFYDEIFVKQLADKKHVSFAEDIYSMTYVSFLTANVEKYKLDKQFGDKLA